jgi:hypothetical protein
LLGLLKSQPLLPIFLGKKLAADFSIFQALLTARGSGFLIRFDRRAQPGTAAENQTECNEKPVS